MAQTQKLTNVTIIRNVLIILLVFYHAFAPYSGSWVPITGFPTIKAYWWFDKLSYAFMLELFVFISGYVFGFQVRKKGGNTLDAKVLLWNKFKRLMVPCMVFSLLYILLYKNINQPLHLLIYNLLNGVGHMWFLPMLFWCFVAVWIIEKMQLNSKLVITILVIAAICSFVPLPLRIGSSMYYMLFFYVGYILQKNGIILESIYTRKFVIKSVISFIILFPILTLLKERIGVNLMGGGNSIMYKISVLSIQKAVQLIYSSLGIVMMLSIVGFYEINHKMPLWMEKTAALSFGVYLFQQFILWGLYYHLTIPFFVGPYWLPFLGFICAMSGSLVLSLLFRKTKIGRLLIG